MPSAALHVATASTLVGVLAVAAFAKVRDPDAARVGWRSLAPASWREWWAAPYVLAGAEVALAVGLLLPDPAATVAASGAVLLLTAFAVVLARAARRADGASCGCFGAWSTEPVTGLAVVRTAGLAALAVVALVVGEGGLVRAVAREATPDVVLGLLGTALLGLVLVLTTALGAARARVATPPAGPVVPDEDGAAAYPVDVNGIPDRTGAPVPDVEVVLAGGQVRSLRHLVGERGLLLVLASPTCGTCREVLAELPAWQDALGRGARILVVTSADRDAILRDFPELEPILALGAGGTAAALGVPGTPAAVLVGVDGRIATRVAAGVDEVFGLLAGTVTAVEDAGRRAEGL
ncbi:hypothetical protein QE364_001050 [Nocardioides zeae]|uniref:Uncharacterized protein n=1 Tax=Nocardioides zeae TaxID=1457234 RepID=A0ACC6IF27_9ACTN|nr:MauE/DoxX family redox-associated membrane protein [Nocardioides zeae]MDR6174832.1 hypothetical protein [Nocardioides zeae]MDR6209358.1 hypothetical protein [Nocardioides zeae]